ncbi:MAG TPA: hypothetical protein VIL46_11795, partial [Gemmataceae bacterium]
GTPMTHKWVQFTTRAVLAAALAASSARAQDDGKPLANEDPVVAELKKQLKQFDAVLGRLELLEKNLHDTQTKSKLSVGSLQTDVAALKMKVDQIQRDLADLRGRIESGDRVARASPLGGAGQATGRVRLLNNYLEEVSVLVNGQLFRVVPGAEMALSVPAGAFTYQVLQWQAAPQTRNLRADETYTIRIHPQGQ